eukprot:gene4815-9605_t
MIQSTLLQSLQNSEKNGAGFSYTSRLESNNSIFSETINSLEGLIKSESKKNKEKTSNMKKRKQSSSSKTSNYGLLPRNYNFINDNRLGTTAPLPRDRNSIDDDAKALIEQLLSKSKNEEKKGRLPPKLEAFKAGWAAHNDRIQPPLYQQLSPRSRRKISQLPPPTDIELNECEKLAKKGEQISGDKIYMSLDKISNDTRAKSYKDTNKDIKNMNSEPSLSSTSAMWRPVDPDHEVSLDKSSSSYFDKRAKTLELEQLRQKSRRATDRDNDNDNHHMDSEQQMSSSSTNFEYDHEPILPSLTENISYRTTPIQIQSELTMYLDTKRPSSMTSLYRHRHSSASLEETMLSPPHDDPAGGGGGISSQTQTQSPTRVPSRPRPSAKRRRPPSSLPVIRASSPDQLVERGNQPVMPFGSPFRDGRSTLLSPDSSLLNPLCADDLAGLETIYPEDADLGLFEHYRPLLLETTVNAEKLVQSYSAMQSELRDAVRSRDSHMKRLDPWKAEVYDKDGIDVDPAFNRQRLFGKAIDTLFYHMSTLLVRHTFGVLKRHMISTNQRRRFAAIVLLTRVVRGFIARTHMYKIRHNKQIQQRAVERRAKEWQDKQSWSSLIILLAWRFSRTRQNIEFRRRLNRAAVRIQSVGRGFIARQSLASRREKKQRMHVSAVRIQCLWRMQLAARELELRKKLEAVRRWQTGVHDRLEMFRMEFRKSGAAVCISSAYRSHVMRERLMALLYWNRFMVAIDFQRLYRGYRARKRYRVAMAEKRLRLERRRVSGIRIQSWFRRLQACRVRDKLLEAKELRRMERVKRKQIVLEGGWYTSMKLHVFTAVRAVLPFRQIIATRIQRFYRGYRGRKLVMKRRYRLILEPIFAQKSKNLKAASLIQRAWRGHRVRKDVRKIVRYSHAVRIQCWWRFHTARRRVIQIRNQMTASSILVHWVRSRLIHRKYLRIEKGYLSRNKQVKIIQRLIRKFQSKCLRHDLKQRRRVQHEINISASLSTTKALGSIQLTLLAESVERTIGKKWTTRSSIDCVCLGPIQALFVLALGKKGHSDQSALASNRMDGSSMLKLALKIPGLFVETKRTQKSIGNNSNNNSVSSQRLQSNTDGNESITSAGTGITTRFSAKSSSSSAAAGGSSYTSSPPLSLFEALRLGLICLPGMTRKITKSEFDIAFNKSKLTPGSNVLTYPEFCSCLKYLGDLAFESSFPYAGNITDVDESSDVDVGEGYEAMGDTLTASATTYSAMEVEASEVESFRSKPMSVSSSTSGSVQHSDGGGGRRFRTLKADNNRKGVESMLRIIRARYSSQRYKIFFPLDAFITERETARLLMAILFLSAAESEEWMVEIVQWLEAESRAQLGYFASRIQRLIRRKNAKTTRQIMKQNQLNEKKYKFRNISAKILQNSSRLFLARLHLIQKAQVVIKKYVPHTGPPYWYNPTTDTTSWHKPKVLGSYDCLSIPTPVAGLQYMVYCSNCERQATVNCLNCEDSMCQICFTSLHCKGSRKKHVSHAISMCSLCTMQMATKACTTCALRKPKKGSVQLLLKRDLSVMCDNCFCHVHDHREAHPETNWAKRDANRALESSLDASLVGQALHEKLITDHKYSFLVQPCEECLWRAAAWRCNDCDQVYCDKCLIGLHSLGGPFGKHQAETLPYYSPSMHRCFESGALSRRVADRVERVAQAFARFNLEKKLKAIVKVQAWWRMILGARVGREFMKVKRLEKRTAYRIRRIENIKYRSKLSYKLKDICGIAPVLKSDNKEELALKRITFLGRPRAREYIWSNQDDWGFYKTSRTEPRKGIPHKGFDVGTIDELKTQALKGGFRMPGTITMGRGEVKHATLCDLSRILYPGEFLRIDKYVFGIVKINNNELVLDRRWRGLDGATERIYRLPCLRDEKKRRYMKIRHMMYDIIVTNPFSQTLLKAHMDICLRIARSAKTIIRAYKTRGFMDMAHRWVEYSNKYTRHAEWSSVLLEENNVKIKLVDLSEIGTNEVKQAFQEREDLQYAVSQNDIEDMPFSTDKKRVRVQKESNMTVPSLLQEAELWETTVNVMTDRKYYVHKVTGEKTYDVPKSVELKQQRDKEDLKKKEAVEETRKKIAMLSKKGKS